MIKKLVLAVLETVLEVVAEEWEEAEENECKEQHAGRYTGWTEKVSIDWSQVAAAAAPPRLDRNIYGGKVITAEAKLTRTAKPSIALRIEATTRYENEKLDKSYMLFDNLVFTQDGAFKAKQIIEALKIKPPGGSDIDYNDLKNFADGLVGKKIWMLVGARMYEGKKFNCIERYLAEGDIDDVHDEEIDVVAVN